VRWAIEVVDGVVRRLLRARDTCQARVIDEVSVCTAMVRLTFRSRSDRLVRVIPRIIEATYPLVSGHVRATHGDKVAAVLHQTS
jgi:hypothetical protein